MKSFKEISPLGNHILVKRVKATASQGGILLPDSAQEKPAEGKVVAVGPGETECVLELKVGDQVLFRSFSGTAVEPAQLEPDDEGEYLIMSEQDVLAVIT